MDEAVGLPPHRIALVTGVLNLGGTTTFLCNLAGDLIRRGIPAEVFCFEHANPLGRDFARLYIPVFTTDERSRIFEDRLVSILIELARFQPTTVVASLSATSFEVLRYLPPGICRFGMAQSHDPGVYRTVGPYAAHLDCLGAVSRTIQAAAAALPEFASVPVHYLPYGVPMPENASPAPGTGTHGPLRILYFGRLDQEQKRVRLFPEILAVLMASGIPFHWTIAGEGPESQWLQSNLRDAPPAQTVSFAGKVLYGDVPALLARHDVFLLASDYEGLPLSLLEAMAHGLVPVVSDLPSGIGEVVDQTNGRRIDPAHAAGYAEAIIRLHQHRDELCRLRQNARDRVQLEFSVAAMTARWLKTLPPPPGSPPPWPARRWAIKPILLARDPWRFSPPLRMVRRLLLKWRMARG